MSHNVIHHQHISNVRVRCVIRYHRFVISYKQKAMYGLISRVFWCKFNIFLICVPVFRPISVDAKLQMNPRSDVDFSCPKTDLTVNLSEVAIELNRLQVRVRELWKEWGNGDNVNSEKMNICRIPKWWHCFSYLPSSCLSSMLVSWSCWDPCTWCHATCRTGSTDP